MTLLIALQALAAVSAGELDGSPAVSQGSRGGPIIVELPAAAPSPREVLQVRAKLAGAASASEGSTDEAYLLPTGARLIRDVPFFEANGFVYEADVVVPEDADGAAIAVQISHRVEGRRQAKAFLEYDDALLDRLAFKGWVTVLADHHGADAPELRVDRPELILEHGAALLGVVRARAREWGGDPDRIALIGFSKGGASAALIAAAADTNARMPPVRVAAAFSAYLDPKTLLDDGLSPRSQRWTDSLAAWGDPGANAAVWDRAAALSHVTPGDPPVLVFAGAADGYRPAQARRMTAALAAAGVTHRLIVEPGLGHRMTLDPTSVAAIETFLSEHTRPRQSQSAWAGAPSPSTAAGDGAAGAAEP